MAIVKEYISGNCKVYIHDDYFVKTKEEVDAILENVAKIYMEYFLKEAIKEQEEKERKEQEQEQKKG